MPLKLEQTDERLTRRTGLILVNRFGDKINLASKIDRLREIAALMLFHPGKDVRNAEEMKQYLDGLRGV